MKNTSGKMIVMAVGLGICLSAIPVSVKGSLPEGADAFQGEVEDISYIVDFFDYDGTFLDSRICMYGETLEDIKVPERAEDEEYTYRFTGWEPGLCEIVTESAAYMAVYEKIPKDGSDPVIPEVSSNSIERAEPGNTHPESPKQISSISYEVVPIPAEKSAEAPAEESTEAPAETPDYADGQPGRISGIVIPVIPDIHIPKITMGKSDGPVNAEIADRMETSMDTVFPETRNLAGRNDVLPDEDPEYAEVKIPDEEKTPVRTVAEKTEDVPKSAKKQAAITQPPEKPETVQASIVRQNRTSGSRMPVPLLLAGILTGGGYVLYRGKRNS